MSQAPKSFDFFELVPFAGSASEASGAPTGKVSSVYQYKATGKYAVKRDGSQVFQARFWTCFQTQNIILLSTAAFPQLNTSVFVSLTTCSQGWWLQVP